MVCTGITFTFIFYIITLQTKWTNEEKNGNVHSPEHVRNLQRSHRLDSYQTSSATKFRAFYWTHRFITVFTRPCHWSWYWGTWIRSTTSQPIPLKFTCLLYYTECLKSLYWCIVRYLTLFRNVWNNSYETWKVWWTW